MTNELNAAAPCPETTPTNEAANNPTPEAGTSEPTPGRAADGKFAKGNRGGPGNPFARQTAQLRQAMVNAVTPEDMADIAAALKKKAKEGDVPAAKLLLSYSIGKPVEPLNPDTLDYNELRTIMTNHLDNHDAVINVLKGMPLSIIMDMFSIILPILRKSKVAMTKEVLCTPFTEEEIEAAKERREAIFPGPSADDDDDDVATEAGTPGYDPLANIPEWMQNIGKEEQPAATPMPAPPAATPPTPTPITPEDVALLRLLLERAGKLPPTAPVEAPSSPPPGDGAELLTELLRTASHGKVPSTNGSNGHK